MDRAERSGRGSAHSFVVGSNKAKNAEFNMKLANKEEGEGFSLAGAGDPSAARLESSGSVEPQGSFCSSRETSSQSDHSNDQKKEAHAGC